MKLRQLLESAAGRLAGGGAPAAVARLEAEILLAHALEVHRSFLYAHPELEIPPLRGETFNSLLRRRLRGEPVAYLTGTREFWSLTMEVSPAVLIPRPETELLVEAALQRIPPGRPVRVADLGTGSGAVALAIACERPAAEVHATDVSAEALEVARGNAARLKLGRLRFHCGSWLEPLTGEFDLIVANPPYVAEGDPHLSRGDTRFEPSLALVAGADGLAAVREISGASRGRLTPGGWLLLEHGNEQGEQVRALLTAAGLEEVATLTDLAQRERVTLGRRRA